MQHSLQNLLPHRQDPINFGTRERRVQEESNLDVLYAVAELLTKHCRHQHEMVIVDPDEVVVLHLLCNFLGEDSVRVTVGNPGLFIEGNLARMVVEERPEDRVGETVVCPASPSTSASVSSTPHHLIFLRLGGKGILTMPICHLIRQPNRHSIILFT